MSRKFMKTMQMFMLFAILFTVVIPFTGDAKAEAEENPAYNGLLAYEPFDYAAGAVLNQLNGGDGWKGGWEVQNGNESPTGFRIADAAPLSYLTLDTSTTYMVGGTNYGFAKRYLDLSANGPFKDYLTADGKNVGKPGTTLWASMLVSKNTDNNDLLRFSFISSAITFGYLGDKTDSTRYWSIIVGERQVNTYVPIVIGQPILAVFKIEFGETNKVSLFIDPLLLGGGEPDTPDASVEKAENTAFNSLNFVLSQTAPGNGSIGDIRLGETYAAVTPAKEDSVPPQAPSNLQATDRKTSSITLNWDAAADNLGISGYKVYLGNGEVAITKNTSYTVASLAMETEYLFHVTAFDAAGYESPGSNIVTAETLPPVQASVTIDKGKQHQRIEGFGGYQVDPKDSAYTDMLIDDLGLSILRVDVPTNFEIADCGPLSADDGYLQQPCWNIDGDLDPVPRDITKKQGTSLSQQILMINQLKQSAEAKNVPLKIISSVWSPPWWMKYNHSIFCGNCGVWGPGIDKMIWNTLIQEEIPSAEVPNDYKQAFTDRLVAYVKILKEQTGVDLYAISVQNEPAFSQSYSSAVYTDVQLRNLIKFVGQRFEQEGLTTKIFGPEDATYNARIAAYFNAIGEDPAANNFTDIFAIHGYENDGSTAADPVASSWAEISELAKKFNKPLWMTETSGFNHDVDGMMGLAKSINNTIQYGNAEAFVYWTLINARSKIKESLLTPEAGEPSILSAVLSHYGRYVRPGAIRVESSSDLSDLLVTSYIHPTSGQQTTVLVNLGPNTVHVQLNVQGGNVPSELTVYRSSEYERVVNLGTLNIDDSLSMPAHSIVTLAGNTGTPDEGQLPAFVEQPQSAAVSPTSFVKLSAQVVGTPSIAYQWYKDGVGIPNATGNQYSIKSFSTDHAGSYTVKATNAFGSVMSDPAVLSVDEFNGFRILRTSQAPIIGQFDASRWENAQTYALSKPVAGIGPGNIAAEDHSGTVKALWDDTNLYLSYTIKDDVLVALDSTNSSFRDDVELFLDRNNSKNSTYGPEGFQFVFAYDDTVAANETKQGAVAGVIYKVKTQEDGYIVEASIPWTTIGIAPSEGWVMGWDMASDDTDGNGRKSKIAYHTTSNEIWHDPTNMGVAMLWGDDAAPSHGDTQKAYIGKPFDLAVGIEQAATSFNALELTIQYDSSKLAFSTESFGSADHPGALTLTEDAISMAPGNPGLQLLGTVVTGDGRIHLAAAKAGEPIAAADMTELFVLHGAVKPDIAAGTTIVSVVDGKVSENGEDFAVDGNSYMIELMEAGADKTALGALISTASGTLNAAIIGTAPGQYPLSAKTALQTAINQAQTALDDPLASQRQVNQAVADLQQAVNTFNASVIVAELNKTELIELIAKSQAIHDSAEEGMKLSQYAAGSKAALLSAIQAAASSLGAATTQQQLNSATGALSAALQSFNSQIVTLIPGATQITLKDLSLLAKYYGKSREEANWDQYDTANIYGDGITIQVLAKAARLILEGWLTEQ